MNPDYPAVKIYEVEPELGKLAFTGNVNLGSRETGDLNEAWREVQIGGLLKKFVEHSKMVFLLIWEGNKIPRGAVICGHTIAWMQHGMVTSEQGETIGFYQRLMEFGGKSGKEQRVLVFVDEPSIKKPVKELTKTLTSPQNCWKTRTVGISFAEQEKRYPEQFKPWPPREGAQFDLQECLETLREKKKRIEKASDVLKLQECLLICNLNDFMMRDNPNIHEFTAIAKDSTKWSMMLITHIRGGRAARAQYRKAVQEIQIIAIKKFKELAGQ